MKLRLKCKVLTISRGFSHEATAKVLGVNIFEGVFLMNLQGVNILGFSSFGYSVNTLQVQILGSTKSVRC